MYLRFTVAEIDRNSACETGIFVIAYRLVKSDTVPEYERVHLRRHLDWFGDHLAIPNRFTASKPPFYRKQNRAISWFKDTALEHIARIRDIARIVENQGVHVTMITTDRPGYVVYEDDHQIVAEPFADSF